MSNVFEPTQQRVCERFNVSLSPCVAGHKVGAASNIGSGLVPLNGLRHPLVGDTTGWYLWAGENDVPKDDNFFRPLCWEHLQTECPQVIKYLGLPPGWRFIIAGEYEDVWFDETLLDMK